ncbi:MAG: glycosyltransferase [Planctomycetota bacterium]|jgi:glycosyltransferase
MNPGNAEPPDVSVVTPCLNGMPYLRDAVASVERCAQSSGLCVEHVVSDGVSTDGTLEFLNTCPLVRLQSEPDDGVYHALNSAIEKASGRFLVWLNTDDWFEPEFLAAAVAQLSKDEQLDGVLGDTQFVTEEGELAERLNNSHGARGSLLHLTRSGCHHLNAGVYRTRSVRSLGPFSTEFRLGGDRDFAFRMVHAGLRLAHIEQVAYRFRRHSASLTEGPTAWLVINGENFLVDSMWARRTDLSPELRTAFLRRVANHAIWILAHPHPSRPLRRSALRWLLAHPVTAAGQAPRRLMNYARRIARRVRGGTPQ